MNDLTPNVGNTKGWFFALTCGFALSLAGCHNTHEQQQSQAAQAKQRVVMQDASRAKMAMEMVQVSGARMMHFVKPPQDRENYQRLPENSIKRVIDEPVSTFSIDVDTGSYTNTRRMLVQGQLPPSDAVRVEEFINYFDYQYQPPVDNSQPFAIDTALSTAPWHQDRHLLRIGLKGAKQSIDRSAGSNLVFLIDVSGSMSSVNKLPLLKRSLTLLSQQLSEQDSVAIVVYAGASGVVLEPTAGNNTIAIKQALDQLSSGGSTNGAAGIELAYQMAQKAFIKGGVNRVLLATDGDFNVGVTNQDSLVELIEKQRENGIALTTLGFGQGNYNDHLMEQLADVGNGNYAYIDTINEARKVLVDELSSTMQIIAKDVKIQVEFNPALVSEYRLLGYENRVLNSEDFNNDKVDAGDIGAGHTVTAFYEVILRGSEQPYNDPLRYQNQQIDTIDMHNEIAHVKLRYKQPEGKKSALISEVVKGTDLMNFDRQPQDFRFAVAVVSFAQRLKNSDYNADLSFSDIIAMAKDAKGKDDFGYRSEFIQLVRTADALSGQYSGVKSPDSEGKDLIKLGRYESPYIPVAKSQ